MRTSKLEVEEGLRAEILNLLPELLGDLKGSEQIKSFLENFLSPKEYEVISKRLAILYWLHKGKKYHDIRDHLKVSSATIATTQELIAKKEITEAFRILDANEWASKVTERIKSLLGTKTAV